MIPTHLFYSNRPKNAYKGPSMDADVFSRNEVILLPDADVSDPEIEDCDEEVILDSSSGSDQSDDSSEIQENSTKASSSKEKSSIVSSNKAKSSSLNPKHVKASWKILSDDDKKSKIPDFNGPTNQFGYDLENPISFFKRHWTRNMTDTLVEQSNLYALQKGAVLDTNPVEVNKFLGIILRMGIVGLPRYNMYWMEGYRLDSVCNAMSRDRFFKLMRYLHFTNNDEIVTNRSDHNYNRLAKVQPLLDMFRKQCLELVPDQVQNIDEQVIPFKGKHSLKQYMKNKPKKWGFKVFSRNSPDGYWSVILLTSITSFDKGLS